MANTTLTASVVAKAALAILDNELGWLKKLYRAHESEFSNRVNGYKIGDTVSIRRPADFTVRSGATMDLQDVIEGKTTLTIDQQIGVDIVRRSLEEPMRQIVINAGLEGSVVVNKVKEGKDAFGFNAATEKYEDLLKAGVLDPTKVTRSALENAASVSGLLLMTEALITDKKEETPAMPAMPPGGGMPGGMGGMY